MDTYSASPATYCNGYMIVPIVEACRQGGLFDLLDPHEYRERTWIMSELKANASYFTIALEALESLGWLERQQNAFRRTAKADSCSHGTKTLLYAHAPEDFIAEPASARILGAQIALELAQAGAVADPALGAMIVPLMVGMHGTDAGSFAAWLSKLDPALAQVVIALFVRQGWLTAETNELTAAGETLVEYSEFGVADSFRPLLHRIGDVLFGDLKISRSLQQQLRTADPHEMSHALHALANEQPAYYVDADGGLLDPFAVLSARQKSLTDLAQSMPDSPMLMVEAHAGPFPDPGSCLRRIDHQYPISAEAFLLLASSAGLFNETRVTRYPPTSGPCLKTVHSLVKRNYKVRVANEEDLDRLCELEELCWQHTRTSPEQIAARLRQYPQGQLVLEDEKVLGVIYSQRIARVDQLLCSQAAEVHTLHEATGPIVQLLAVNIDPKAQNLGYGDQLLEFMLQRCSLLPGIEQVVGVTLCKKYNPGHEQTFADYIQQQGESQDPILAFHQAHGARIGAAIPGYRPQDTANAGNGVLVVYDIHNRVPQRRQASKTGAAIVAPQVSAFVEDQAARLLGIATESLDLDRPLMEMGLDSADLLKLQAQCEEKWQMVLQSGVFFEHNSLRKVIHYLSSQTAKTAPEPTRPPSAKTLPAGDGDDGKCVAVIGVSCKFPGGIETLQDLWRVLANQKCVVGSYPAARGYWPSESDFPAIGRGGFVDDVDAFDAAFFRISPAEAETIDPQQRILLQLAWACLEDAGIVPETVKGTNTGVFIGASNTDYGRLQQEAGLEVEAHHGTGNSLAILANRLSYFFDCSGPSLVIDTACSSSLVALHAAMQSLRTQECGMALVGGVNVICHPALSIAYHKAGMLAGDGRCKVFDAAADGYVRSEGAAMVLLKPLSAALAAGDNIHAVIRGSATNHGGLAGGLTVPNPGKQCDLLTAAWQDAGIDANHLTYLEAHGTGTSLGDPIEVQGIQAAHRKSAEQGFSQPCAIGSVKSNLGHLEPAAGMAGLLKVILCLQQRQIPAMAHFDRLNPKIKLDDGPFFIPRETRDWPGDGPRLAGVSSFGSGGANAHVVVQEYRCPSRPTPAGEHLFLLSANDQPSLRIYVSRVINWLEHDAAATNFADAIYTWQAGRAAMKQRLAMKVDGPTDLIRKLKLWLAASPQPEDGWWGQASSALAEKMLEQLATPRVSGSAVDWVRHRQRVSLPTYPFAKDRYWIKRPNKSPLAAGALHPLLHRNTSDSSGARFTSVFTGDEFFLADHRVQGVRVLPAVCYLEMARAAVMESATGAIRFKDVLWMSPIRVREPLTINIRTFVEEQQEIGYEIYSGAGDGELLHGRGKASLLGNANDGDGERMDWPSLLAACHRRIDATECYATFAAMGIEYGPAHRCIRSLHLGQGANGQRYVLAEVSLPPCVRATREDYGLHPSVLDGALQAAIAGFPTDENRASLPFELEEVEIFGSTPTHAFVYVRQTAGTRANGHTAKLDVDVCDESGRVWVRLKGFVSRLLERDLSSPDAAMAGMYFVPRWEPVTPAFEKQWPLVNAHLLVVGGTAEEQQALRAHYPAVSILLPEERVDQIEAIDHVVWLVPASEAETVADELSISEQAVGVLRGLRLIRDFLSLGYESRPMGWTVITRQTQAAGADTRILPSHASVHGLIGSLAKEYPQWKVRLVDLPLAEAWPLDALLRLAADPLGDPWVYRAGEWYRQRLLPCRLPSLQPTAYRQHGVYVVIGGAGGLGEAFSEHLIRTYHAQMVWIGRRALDADIQAKRERLATVGPVPAYVQADATDRAALTRAYGEIKLRYGRIDGLVHAAIALADKSLAQMEEDRFHAGLAAKVDASVRMAQVFAQEPLDWVLFFSSFLSFLKPAGQSNYLSGCTFEDAFAQQLARSWACPVKTMHWGYWGSKGIVASETYRTRMAQKGIGSIEPAEGMAALEQFLSSPLSQVVFAKLQPRVLEAIVLPQEQITLASHQLPVVESSPRTQRAFPEPAQPARMQHLMMQLLFHQLQGLGQTSVPAFHGRWLQQSAALLAGAGDLTGAGEAAIWREWDEHNVEWLADASLSGQVKLVDATLRALPEILRGKRPATDILFPRGSMELVQGFYHNNPGADYFNAMLAETVEEFVTLRRRHDPTAPIRILEIGAGTGGTSQAVFRLLKPHESFITEYCYSDISKAFLMHAEKAFGPTTPYLRYRLFNVERPLEAQELLAGSYDLVIATNVLHATKNIRNTLRNAKALLLRNGLLLLNELTAASLFTHLTFGLLEGWWLPEDTAVRIPGTPMLAPETWQRVLTEEGFGPVLFPAFAAQGQGQQVMVAQSDGIIRQSKPVTEVPRESPQPAPLAQTRSLHDKAVASLKRIVSQTLKLPVQQIDAREDLDKYGIDSILIVSMVDALRNVFAHISSSVFFEHRTIAALADHFIEDDEESVRRWVNAGETPGPATSFPAVSSAAPRRRGDQPKPAVHAEPSQNTRTGHDIAIIGLSGRYPEAWNVEAFWRNLCAGKDCVIEVPRERWDARQYFSQDRNQAGRHHSNLGGFIAGVDEFDPLFFNIAPSEAKYIDPQERLFLQHAWMAVEDAGYTRAGLQLPDRQDLPGQVGVYAGVMYSEYQLLHARSDSEDVKMGFAGNLASIANRVSSVLNLHGPSMTVDTMCSASLSAIHLACQDLQLGRTSMALAGGVNVSVHPNKYLLLSVGQFISSDGHCQSFGAGGNGFIPAEGVGVVVLRRLADAERDGDHIYGIVRGSAINHGGKTNGYTVPNPQAQSSAVSRALAEAQIDARAISYVEAHGTGTRLGDPIEIAALTKAFRQHTQETGCCLIGSVKSNIGHCESAAGIAGLTKVLLQMQHRQIVPSLHAEPVNPNIDFSRTPFVVNQVLRAWEQPVVDGRPVPRVAGISSFGAGGSNAHLIVEEYPAALAAPMASGPMIVLLSARTADQLKQKARDLLEFLDRRGNAFDLRSLAYTLQVGREAMEERVGLVVSSAEELQRKLAAYVAGEEGLEDVFAGKVRGNKELLSLFSSDNDLQYAVEKWITGGKVHRLLELWAKGLEVEWSKLYADGKPQRMSLPVYPFARERYWIDAMAAAPVGENATAAVLHPLLHRNTSDLREQRYSTLLRGEEPWLLEKVLPASACLEMARVAVEKAAGQGSVLGWELRQVVWGELIAVSEPTQIEIVLLAHDGEQIDFEIYSQQGQEETVYCQGRAVASAAAVPARLNLEALRRQMGLGVMEIDSPSARLIAAIDRGDREGLVHLRLPGEVREYVLHPGLLEAALESAVALSGQQKCRLSALDSLRVVAPCRREMFAWVRFEQDEVLNIDLCDEHGNLCAEMRGVRWQPLPEAAEKIAALREPREVFFPSWMVEKPTRIALPAPSVFTKFEIKQKHSIRLSPPMSMSGSAVAGLRVHDEGNGIFSLKMEASSPISPLLQALERVRQESSLKVLKLRGLEFCFQSDACQPLYQALVHFPYPVIGILRGDVIGAGWLAAALCDLLVCNEAARYGCSGSELEASVLEERFGAVVSQGLLYGGQATGMQLQSQGILCAVLGAEQIELYAKTLAVGMAAKTQLSLRLLKEHLARPMVELVARLNTVTVTEAPAPLAETVLQIQWNGIDSFLAELRGHGKCKAIVVVFEGDAVASEATVEKFQQVVWELDVPVVAALQAGAVGAGWLMTQLCDGCVYSRTGSYAAETIGHSAALGATAAATFVYRLGSPMATEVLLTGGAYSGAELQRRVGALRVGEHDQVVPMAMELATTLARRGGAALRQNIAKAQVADIDERPELPIPEENVFSSNVVTVTAYPQGIVVVKMEDREAKNMFSDALLHGMSTAFAQIAQSSEYKVVILTGYDSYFSCGGTKENLLSIQAGKVRFTDYKVFQLALDCKLPVIAAMQGHGIGAGWSLGMFADVVVLSEESRYESPYMNYGFTPGAGATWVLGEKLGLDLARESLFTANQYAGSELKARGLRLRIVPRVEVEAAAMQLASQIARWPRRDLMALKQRLTAHIPALLEQIYRGELAMHDQTFVGQSETLAQIENHFASPREAAPREPAKPMVNSYALSTVKANLKALLANELHLPEPEIDEDVQFIDLGLDSISGVTWIRRINEKYRTSLEATIVYSYPTLAQFSRHVREEAEKQGTLTAPAAPVLQSPPLARTPAANVPGNTLSSWRKRPAARFSQAPAQPIAVIGMSGQFPQASNLEQFWENIAQGRNCVGPVSPDRWDVNDYYRPGKPVAGKTNSQWAGTIENYDRFDPGFFNIAPSEAESIDPQQRLFLQSCWHAIEHAGYSVRRLSGKKCGVFVGCTAGEYAMLSPEQRLSAQGFTGNAMSILAGRICYFLNLQGPCLSIDTACSSSLVAMASACDSLIAGDSDVALAGGVYVMAGPEMHIKTAQAGMLSSVGKCFSFDQRADGFVPGEGVGVVLLKRLADAERDHDLICGVIEGWAVNQDGKTNGITAPNRESQTRLEQQVYDKFQIDPATIQLIEAHGTATKLGDPIEVEGLKKAFAKYTRNQEYCALGSVKSNIGHCMPAAGIAGFLKLMLALQQKQLPPTIHFERLNEHIDLTDSPFYINERLQEWKPIGVERRRAAINSFGFSGTNAHLVVGEYTPAAALSPGLAVLPQNAPVMVPLSAKTTEQLKQKVQDLRDLLRDASPQPELSEMAYTLQVGREAMEERVGFLVSSVSHLAAKLDAYLLGGESSEGTYRGQVKRGRDLIGVLGEDEDLRELILEKWIAQKQFSRLLDLWVKGLDLDWDQLYSAVKPRRIRLPLYPFANQRYWIEKKSRQGSAPAGEPWLLHPLLHRNTSDLREQRYSSAFTGEEFFLADHRVKIDGHPAKKLLPGVAYLEMARAAMEQAIPEPPQSSTLELLDTVWLEPFVVDQPGQLSIVLLPEDETRTGFEIFSIQDGQHRVHCQGQAVFSRQIKPAALDLQQIKRQIGHGGLDAPYVYAMLAGMGLHYGPAHQAIEVLYPGAEQVLAQLRLPTAGLDGFVLHPSLMDGAFQGSIGLILEASQIPANPYVPFALRSLRTFGVFTREMTAWIRYATGSKAGDLTMNIDIDLCDDQGNVCVEVRGLVLRALPGEATAFDSDFYQKVIADVLQRDISIDMAVDLA